MTEIREFSFTDRDTCKESFIFTISDSAAGKMIDAVEIKDRENRIGCKGHPRTIEALLKNRPLDSVPISVLAEAGCPKECSCGQNVAACLETLKAG